MAKETDSLKRCWACGEVKPVPAFAFDNLQLGTRQDHCRRCHAAFRRAHYLANKADYIRRAMAQVRERRDENRRRMFGYLLEHPCVGCTESDPIVLEFDHRDSNDKIGAVAALANKTRWAIVRAEIDKCDVRCVNCHRRRTAHQFGWRKLSARPKMTVTRE